MTPDLIGDLVPALGGASAVVYLLWRILNRDTAYAAINAALGEEIHRLEQDLRDLRARYDLMEVEYRLERDRKHDITTHSLANEHWIRMFIATSEMCECNALEPIVNAYKAAMSRPSPVDGTTTPSN